MPITVGTKLGSYEILALIGVGGIGEVEARCGREASSAPADEAGSPQPKSRAQRGISQSA